MAIAHVGDLGTGLSSGNNQTSLAITTGATAARDSLVVVLIALDNNGTADGDGTSVSGVVDSAGHTYTRGKEYANGSPGSQAGAEIAIYWCRLKAALASGQTITASFTSSTTVDASAMTAKNFSLTANTTLAVDGTPGGADGQASLDVTTANVSCLRVRGVASESSSTTALTPTAGGWAIFTQAISGAGTSATEMGVRGEWIISTATGAASAPTGGAGSVDHASAYVAWSETANMLKDSSFLVM